MVICERCRRIMRPTCNGIEVRWRGSWVRRGDEYTCPTCGACVVTGLSIEGYENQSDLPGQIVDMVE